jgi:hypothetical protein
MRIPARKELSEIMWRRHRNPASGWTRILLFPLFAVALWYHSWTLVAIAAVASITNPFWFPPPKKGDSLMTLMVDGEKIWLARRNLAEKVLFLYLPGIQVIPLVWALWVNHPAWAAYFAAWALAHKTAFVIWAAQIARGEQYDRTVGPVVSRAG